MKDSIELLLERLDQQEHLIENQRAQIKALRDAMKQLQEVEEAESDALHRMKNECSKMVMDAQLNHIRCAKAHGCNMEDVL